MVAGPASWNHVGTIGTQKTKPKGGRRTERSSEQVSYIYHIMCKNVIQIDEATYLWWASSYAPGWQAADALERVTDML